MKPEPELRQRAADFVAEHWREVEALAAALVKHKKLAGDEASSVVDSTKKGGRHGSP